MTLEQLRIFVAVAEREHVTAASRALNLTQSAVSNAVAALEARHDVRLFDRVGRGVALNANGRAFLAEARDVLARAERAGAVLDDLAGLRRGKLAMVASQTIAGHWLPARLARFHARHPGIELDLRAGNTREAGEAVLGGSCELGFVEGEFEHALLEETALDEDRLVLLVPRSHPWASRDRIPPAELGAASWVMREPGSGTRSSLEAALREAGCDPASLAVAMALPSNEAVLGAVESGVGVAALSEHVARAAIATGRLAACPFALAHRRFRLLRHRQRFRTRAADRFVASLGAAAAP